MIYAKVKIGGVCSIGPAGPLSEPIFSHVNIYIKPWEKNIWDFGVGYKQYADDTQFNFSISLMLRRL